MTIKLKSIIAAATAFALLATGTFAFNQTVVATNEFLGQKDGVTLHDDFDPGANQKDVYVENQGSMPMYVRIKLDEAMSLVSHKWRPGASDWVTHTLGTQDADGHWNCGHSNDAEKAFHDYFFWSMGGSKWYMPTDGKKPLIHDTKEYDSTTPGAKQTPFAEIISAAAYIAAVADDPDFAKTFMGWIYDTDGYAYWSQPLLSGEATGLILSGVETAQILMHEEYYYAINVILEAVDIKDIPMWRDGEESEDGSGKTYLEATDDGKTVIDIITGMHPEDPDFTVKILDGNQVLEVGETFTFDVAISSDLTDTPVWTTSNGGVVSVDQNGEITGLAEGTAVITVTVGEYSDSVIVTVNSTGTPEKSVTILGGDKNLDLGEIYKPEYVAIGTTGDPFWTSSNTTAVIIDTNGNIIGIGPGVAVITLTIDGISDSITVAVSGPITDFEPNPGPHTPITNTNPELGDAYYYQVDFRNLSNPTNNMVFHKGAIHLENIITDGNFDGVTVAAADPKYADFIELGACPQHPDKPAILFSYQPTNAEYIAWATANGDFNINIPVQVKLSRGGKSATVTINMLYQDCLVVVVQP